jgi:hypothetical protein
MTFRQFSYLRDPLDHRNFHSSPAQAQLWHDICLASLDDKELQSALERVKVMYYLKYNQTEKSDVRY